MTLTSVVCRFEGNYAWHCAACGGKLRGSHPAWACVHLGAVILGVLGIDTPLHQLWCGTCGNAVGTTLAAVVSGPGNRLIFLKEWVMKLVGKLPGVLTLSVAAVAFSIKYFNVWIANNQAWLKVRHTYWFKTQEWGSLVPFF